MILAQYQVKNSQDSFQIQQLGQSNIAHDTHMASLGTIATCDFMALVCS